MEYTLGFQATYSSQTRRRKKGWMINNKPINKPNAKNRICNDMQSKALRSFFTRKTRHFGIISGTGSGKSTAIIFIDAITLKENPKLRVIRAVPKRIIGSGFTNTLRLNHPRLWTTTNKKYFDHALRQQNDLCNSVLAENGKINRILEWLTTPQITINERQIVITYSILVALFSKLKESNELHLLANTMIWIDESHHICAEEDLKERNGLGELVRFIDQNDEKLNITLCTATATPFRTSGTIFPDEFKAKITNFRYSAIDQFEQYSYDAGFKYYLIPLEKHKEWDKILWELCREDLGKKTIINLARRNTACAFDKMKEIELALAAIAQCKNPQIEYKNGLTLVTRIDGKIKIVLDLADPKKQELSKAIFQGKTDIDPESIDYILNLHICSEGADWVPANRSIIIGHRSSVVEVSQMSGRLTREHISKSEIPMEVYFITPCNKNLSSDTYAEDAKNTIKILMAVMLLEEISKPLFVGKYIDENGKKKDLDSAAARKYIEDYFTDDEYLEFRNTIINQLVFFKDAYSQNMNRNELSFEYVRIINEACKEYGVTKYLPEIKTMIIGALHRQNNPNENIYNPKMISANGIRINDILVNDIPFDIVDEIRKFADGTYTKYISKHCGTNQLIKLRQEIDKLELLWDRCYHKLIEFVHKNNRMPIKPLGSNETSEDQLANWCSRQRSNYKDKTLSPKKIKLLEAISGWFWCLFDRWMVKYNYHKQIILENKSNKITEKWINKQREARKFGYLNNEQIFLLEALPGWFWDIKDIWFTTYEKYKNFERKNKRLPSENSKDKEERSLGNWGTNQRANYKKFNGTISRDRKGFIDNKRIKLLEKIPGWFWEKNLNDVWQKSYEDLKLFISMHKRIPNKNRFAEKTLGYFVSDMRKAYKGTGKRVLTEERIKLLESIPGWTWIGKLNAI